MWNTTKICYRTFSVSFIRKWYETGCKLWLFLCANESCLVYQHNNVSKTEQNLNKNFPNICGCFVDNKLSIHFGEDKTKCILFGTKEKLNKIGGLVIRYGTIQIK